MLLYTYWDLYYAFKSAETNVQFGSLKMITSPHFNCFIEILAITTLLILISIIIIAYNLIEDLDSLPMAEPQYRFWNSKHVVIRKLLHFALLHYALNILLHFASMLLYFALVLHFAAILITFCVNITFCGVAPELKKQFRATKKKFGKDSLMLCRLSAIANTLQCIASEERAQPVIIRTGCSCYISCCCKLLQKTSQ